MQISLYKGWWRHHSSPTGCRNGSKIWSLGTGGCTSGGRDQETARAETGLAWAHADVCMCRTRERLVGGTECTSGRQGPELWKELNRRVGRLGSFPPPRIASNCVVCARRMDLAAMVAGACVMVETARGIDPS
jgi:hypothetical protein